MKQSKGIIPSNVPLDDDNAAMVSAIATLNARGVQFDRPTRHQLKIGGVNFYPAKGRMFRDGCAPEKASGIKALLSLISEDLC